jgi:putative superfamily III holin-X
MATYIEREPTKDLVTGLISDAKELAAGHLGHMRGEIKDEFKNLKLVMWRIAGAVGVLAVAAVLVGHALALALAALGLPVWVSYGVAAIVLLALGGAILELMPHADKDSDLVPEQSLAEARDDLARVSKAIRG